MSETTKDQDATCPKCEGWMYPMAAAEARVDHCTDCKGVWLSPETLARCAAAQTGDAAGMAQMTRQKPPDKGYPAGVKCPGCGWLMLLHTYHGVEVERCPKCRGIYFDHGELERVVQLARTRAPVKVKSSDSAVGVGVAAVVAEEGGWVVAEIAIAVIGGLIEAVVD